MRNHRIDLLRFIGLSAIILAHSAPPDPIFNFRNFDVPLMVLISGMVFGLSFKSQESYITYVWKRVKRLVFPTWIFLTGYFVFLLLFKPSAWELSRQTILSSYLLLEGIGYVWVIRVFMLVALVAPAIYTLFKARNSNKVYVFQLVCILLLYEGARYLLPLYLPSALAQLIDQTLLYLVPYSIVFALGLLVPQMRKQTHVRLGLFFLSVFSTMAIALWQANGDFVPTQLYKYPPSLYYSSYAIAVAIVLWSVSDRLWKVVENSRLLTKVVLFVAQNSMWIYLWHIPFEKLTHMHFLPQSLLMLCAATGVTCLQVWAVNRVVLPNLKSARLKKDMRSLLTG